MNSFESRLAALEARVTHHQDDAPRVIFLKGLRPRHDDSPHSYASSGHVRLSHEDEQQFMRRIRIDIETPERVQLIFLSDEPEWPQHAE